MSKYSPERLSTHSSLHLLLTHGHAQQDTHTKIYMQTWHNQESPFWEGTTIINTSTTTLNHQHHDNCSCSSSSTSSTSSSSSSFQKQVLFLFHIWFTKVPFPQALAAPASFLLPSHGFPEERSGKSLVAVVWGTWFFIVCRPFVMDKKGEPCELGRYSQSNPLKRSTSPWQGLEFLGTQGIPSEKMGEVLKDTIPLCKTARQSPWWKASC